MLRWFELERSYTVCRSKFDGLDGIMGLGIFFTSYMLSKLAKWMNSSACLAELLREVGNYDVLFSPSMFYLFLSLSTSYTITS